MLVVACLRGIRPVWPSLMVTSYYGSIYPSVQNLLLAARAAGLGAALITLPLWSIWLVRRALRLPWRVTPVPWCRWAGRWDGMGRRPAVPSVMSYTSSAMATSRSRPLNSEGAM